jgi:hypothetical protein
VSRIRDVAPCPHPGRQVEAEADLDELKEYLRPMVEEAIVEASRAIYDGLEKKGTKRSEEREAELLVKIGSMIAGRVRDALEVQEAGYGVQLDALRDELEQVRNELEQTISATKAALQNVRIEIQAERSETLAQLAQLLGGLPTPNITVPEGAIAVRVVQEPSVVNLTSEAPVVNVPAEAIRVLLEEGTKVKNISYDEAGRPTTIEEIVKR